MRLISAILIAAGESTRMGSLKPLLRWHGMTLVEYQTSSLVTAGVAEVVVVLGERHRLVEPYVTGPGVRAVVNQDFRLGKTMSIRAGLQSIDPASQAVLLLAVDQPRPVTVISTVIDAHLASNALITSPRYQGRGGHPLVFARMLMPELQLITEEGEGIRQVIRAHGTEVNVVEIDDPIVTVDLNTPEDYEQAKARFGA